MLQPRELPCGRSHEVEVAWAASVYLIFPLGNGLVFVVAVFGRVDLLAPLYTAISCVETEYYPIDQCINVSVLVFVDAVPS